MATVDPGVRVKGKAKPADRRRAGQTTLVPRAVEGNALWTADTTHEIDVVAGCIQLLDRVFADGVDEKMTVLTDRFDHPLVPVYDGEVLKVISAPELARNLEPILKALEESGTTLIVKHQEQPAALLVRFDAYVAMLATMDYSGWERWIEEVRSAFPQSVFSPPRRIKPMAPAFLDPADLGYAPQFGQVGSAAGRRRLGEELTSMGIQLDDAQLGSVYSLVLNLAERKRVLYSEDLRLAVDEALGRATPGRVVLMDLQVTAQSGVSASAEVGVMLDGTPRQVRAVGSGTLDALFRALQQASGVVADLEDFSLAAATQGSDALGEAVVTLSQGSRVVVGRAVALDVVEAAGYAYVNALNWLLRQEKDLAGAAPADQRRG